MTLFNELKRRNVFKVGAAYVVVSWLTLQVLDSIVPIIEAPDWVAKVVLILLLSGFPFALIFAWAFELTPEGIKKESEVDRESSITHTTSRKIDFIIIAALVLIIGGLIYERIFWNEQPENIEHQTSSNTTSIDQSASTLGNKSFQDMDILTAPSIAVLPFANRSNDDDDLYFTDGIQDDILTQLAKIKAMKVTSRTSVMKYRGTDKSIGVIAKELGVNTILEGGVQRAGKRIRINAQLIDVATDEHLWAETY
ncbi:MAG: TolB-like protein, partial [Enterobacterales bacterium]